MSIIFIKNFFNEIRGFGCKALLLHLCYIILNIVSIDNFRGLLLTS